jgi:nucleotide-binding universal stress UspA family protein
VERVFTASPQTSSSLRVDRILCAVTFAPSSRRVVEWAASLARRYEGEVRLFHSMPSCNEPAQAEREADPEQVLKKLLALSQGLHGRPRISAAVTEGDAAAEILRHARIVHANVIAIGMHARDGSVSPLIARIANNAPCPVLVVDDTPSASPVGNGVLNQVVIAINLLPASLAAADYGFALAGAVNARVTAVHVLPEYWEGPRRSDANVDETRQMLERHFRQLLHTAVRDIAGSRGNWSDIVTSGRPCAELIRVAAARDADLIVMGIDAAHKPPTELGGTTSCIMQFVRRTVLLVPERLVREPRCRDGI